MDLKFQKKIDSPEYEKKLKKSIQATLKNEKATAATYSDEQKKINDLV